MTVLRTTTAILLALGLVASAQAEDKKGDTNKEKLVGTWEVSKADEGTVPVGSTLVFTKDGKMQATRKQGDQEETIEGTYKVEGDKLTVTMKRGDDQKEHVVTIKKLTEAEFVAEGPDGKTIECKKKK